MHILSTRSNGGQVCAALLLAAAGGALLPARGVGAGYDSWSKVEQAQETRDYGVQIREGKFDAPQKTFVAEMLLPQLGLDANRASIATVRQRIRDVALRGATKKEVVDQGNTAIRDGMLRLVADNNAELLVRVNAMLLVGELQDLDRAPWPGSLMPLAKAAGDAALPLAIRVAALNGLARHVAGAAAGGPAATAAAPVVAGLVTSPPEGDPAAVRWLLSRALDLLPRVPAPASAVAAAAGILADEKADLDLRVRAAAAVGGLAKADSGVDAAAAVAQMKQLAITAVVADLDMAEGRRSSRKLSGSGPLVAGFSGERDALTPPASPEGGGGIFGGQVGGELAAGGAPAVVDEDSVPTLACRRNAWRLFTLAEAIKPARSGAGLAGLLSGDAATAAADLATRLRELAIDLDKQPDEPTLATARAELGKLAAPGQAAAPAAKPAGQPGPGGTEPSPFDQPAGGSPF
jgi:hypothetical protein